PAVVRQEIRTVSAPATGAVTGLRGCWLQKGSSVMPTTTTPQRTDFSIDVLGRYVCNGWGEALASPDAQQFPGPRPFDMGGIGGGSFGAALASHLFQSDKDHRHRTLVLEAGPFDLPEHVQNLPPPLDGGGVWSSDVWNSDSPQSWNKRFPGLAFCVGGRSLFW